MLRRDACASVTAQVACRPVGVILGIATSLNPFAIRERYKPWEALPLSERLVRLRDPGVRRAIFDDRPSPALLDADRSGNIAGAGGRRSACRDDRRRQRTDLHADPLGRARTRGPGLPLEYVVKRQTSETADFFGFRDRGRLEADKRADINLIDFERLRLHAPEVVHDLPAGGKRLVQRAEGYAATLVAGIPVFERGEHIGAKPGRLVRRGR